MADNLQIDEGTSGKYASTDDCTTAGHVARTKLCYSADGDATHVTADANGLEVQGAGTAGAPAGGVVSVQGVGSGTTLPTTDANGAAIKTAVELIDDAVYVDDADWTDSTSKHLLVGGLYQSTPQTITDGDVGPLQTDSTGKLLIGNASIALADAAAAGSASGIIVMGKDGSANAQMLTTDTDGHLQVDLNAGTNAIGKLAANSGVDIGDVDVLSVPNRTVAQMIQWSHYANSYNTAQTSTDLVATSGSTKIYIGCIRISTGYVASATTTTVKVYLGTSTWSATEQTVFAGEFSTIPGTGLVAYPSVVIGNGAAPFIISAAGDALKITTSASTHCVVYVSVDYIQV